MESLRTTNIFEISDLSFLTMPGLATSTAASLPTSRVLRKRQPHQSSINLNTRRPRSTCFPRTSEMDSSIPPLVSCVPDQHAQDNALELLIEDMQASNYNYFDNIYSDTTFPPYNLTTASETEHELDLDFTTDVKLPFSYASLEALCAQSPELCQLPRHQTIDVADADLQRLNQDFMLCSDDQRMGLSSISYTPTVIPGPQPMSEIEQDNLSSPLEVSMEDVIDQQYLASSVNSSQKPEQDEFDLSSLWDTTTMPVIKTEDDLSGLVGNNTIFWPELSIDSDSMSDELEVKMEPTELQSTSSVHPIPTRRSSRLRTSSSARVTKEESSDVKPYPVKKPVSDAKLGVSTSKVIRRSRTMYQCHLCYKEFTRPFNLKSHLRSHNGERPYACDFPGCHLAFTRLHDQKRHQKTHCRPDYICEDCGRGFHRPDAYHRHRSTSAGKRTCQTTQTIGIENVYMD